MSKIRKIFYINLDSATDRRDGLEKQLTKVLKEGEREKCQRFKAVSRFDILQSPFQYIWQRLLSKRASSSFNSTVRLGLTGCYLSHTTILHQEAKEGANSKDYFLVFEDDVVFSSSFSLENIQNSLDSLPSGWEVCRFDVWNLTSGPWVQEVEGLAGCYRANISHHQHYYGGTHLVAYRYATLPSLIKKLSKLEIDDYDHICSHESLNSYVFQNKILHVNFSLPSDRISNFVLEKVFLVGKEFLSPEESDFLAKEFGSRLIFMDDWRDLRTHPNFGKTYFAVIFLSSQVHRSLTGFPNMIKKINELFTTKLKDSHLYNVIRLDSNMDGSDTINVCVKVAGLLHDISGYKTKYSDVTLTIFQPSAQTGNGPFHQHRNGYLDFLRSQEKVLAVFSKGLS